MDAQAFLAERVKTIGSSGIRRVFDLGASLKDPIDLSIGQPDFPVPDPVKEAMVQAVREDRNGYTHTRGIPQLRERIAAELKQDYAWEPDVFITSGVSGGLLLSMLACINPGDEVLVPDPFFVSYPHLVRMAGGVPVFVDLYDDFGLHPERYEAAITERTKMMIVCSPSNPTGTVLPSAEFEAVAKLAAERNILLLSDEIYAQLTYDGPHTTPIPFAKENTLLLRGYGKSYGLTGWRMGYAAGPAPIIAEMAKLQQYTFVCAPQPAQHACVAAMDVDMTEQVATLRAKRDLVCELLEGAVEFVRPGGGFYVYPKVPAGFANATEFVEQAIANNLLIIPGEVFSQRNTHFRISYAAPEAKVRAGCEVIRKLAGK
jgi:aspartate/methionine/tyrosine aminotransferase